MNISRGSRLRTGQAQTWPQTAYTSVSQLLHSPTLVGIVGAAVAVALLLIPPLPWNIRIPLYLSLLIWTVLRPRIALYMMAFAVPWGSLDYLNLGSLRLNAADILVGFLLIGWLLSWGLPDYMGGARDRAKGSIPSYLILSLLLLVGAMLLSLKVAINLKDGLKEIFKWLEFLAVLLVGTQYIRNRKQVWILVICIILAALTQAFFGYAQAIFNLGPASFIRSSSLRIYGTFDQPNPYAGYLNMSLVVLLAILILGKDWLTRLVAGIGAALIGGAFALTQSRGGQIALVAGLFFILLAGFPQIRVWMRIALVALFITIEGFVSGLLPSYLLEAANRFLGLSQISLLDPNTQNFSTAERLAHWIAGLRMYQAHPLLGVGIGNYPDAYPHYYVTIFVNSLGQAHNYYINIAAETGTIGLVIYLGFIIALLVAGGRAVWLIGKMYWQSRQMLIQTEPILDPVGTRNKLRLLLHPANFLQHYQHNAQFERFGKLTNDRALAIGLMAALITVCVHNLVDDLYDHSLTNLLALLIIALLGLGSLNTPVENI